MPKQVIVSMQENYPFGECEEVTGDMVRVLVRKVYQINQMQDDLEQKVSILRKLKSQQMIRIQSVLQEEETIHFMFEYVPIKLQTWISNINDQFIENFRDQLIKFSSYLANNYIKIEFQLKNIGMDQNYGAKYFLDLNFEFNRNLNRQKLKSNYIRQITNLFKPYIQSSSKVQSSLDSDRQIVSVDYGPRTNDISRRNDTSISPPTNRASNNNKNKEKALEKYYQEVNMSVDSENQKILQEFMDVLDNEEQEQHSMPGPNKNASMSAPAPLVSTSQPIKVQHQSSLTEHKVSGQGQGQGNGGYFSSKEIAKVKEVKDSGKGTLQQSSPVHQQHQQQTNPLGSSGSAQIEARESREEESKGGDPRGSAELSRNGDELQSRVKKAIEKSMDVIKKFKLIKDNMQ